MPTDPKDAMRAYVHKAQERYESEAETARNFRRDAFARAQAEGLTLREIGDAVGLHHTRVSQIIRGA
jgi:hypothetical protein